jgi:hypothetical protein
MEVKHQPFTWAAVCPEFLNSTSFSPCNLFAFYDHFIHASGYMHSVASIGAQMLHVLLWIRTNNSISLVYVVFVSLKE